MSDELALYEQESAAHANRWLAQAQTIDITDGETAQMAADLLVEELTPRRQAVEAFFAPLVAAAHAAHRALTGRRAAILSRFDEPERIVRAKLAAWREQSEAARTERIQQSADKALALRLDAGAPQIDGIAFAEKWTAEVVDVRALCRAVADGAAPVTLVAADMKVLNQLARSLKSAFSVPGCRAVKSESVRRSA